jgi:hypothetical protein
MTMKHLMRSCAAAAVLVLPLAAIAQNGNAQDTPAKAAPVMTMSCPMMGEMGSMHADMGAMMSDLETMMKDSKDTALKEKLEGMRKRMSAMAASMQKMSDMHSVMMARTPSTATTPPTDNNAASATPEGGPRESAEDHKAHHPEK